MAHAPVNINSNNNSNNNNSSSSQQHKTDKLRNDDAVWGGWGGVDLLPEDLLPEDLLPVVVGWLDGSICHGFRCSGSDQVQPAEEVEDRVVDDQRRSAGGRSGRRRRRRRRRRRAVPPQRSQRPPAPLKKKERNDELYRCFIRFSVAFTIGLRIFTRLG